ncbi:MAG TPA: hypothetical protein VFO77_12005, partial [Actinoplanes sp.]|nr:hypothetical protein [Actinoplanes sp.]
MNDATMGASPAVVLLRDARWPQVPGVCCWRDGVVGAFAAAGAAVTSVECRPQQPAPAPAPVRVAAPAGAPTARRADWLPDPLRTVLVKAYRRARRSPAGPHRTVAAAARPESPPPARGTGAAEPAELSRADLVIAESLGAAATAARAGVPSRRLWVLALPPQWLPPGDGATGFAKELVAVADLVGGFLTDSELARESIERALSTRRPRVELFPPLAADRRCDACADAEPAAQPATDVDPAVTQLRRWRALRGSATDAVPYSFVAARLLGLDAPWAPMTRSDWQDGADTTPLRLGAEDGPADTSAAAQDRTAAAVLRGVLPEPGPPGRVARRAVVAGFDLKFAADLADRLARRDDLEIAVDDWPTLAKGTDRTEKHLDHADAVFAEWARTSAVWLSRNKRPGQFLAVRLHRFELDAKYPREIDMSNVDAVVYIAPLFGRRIRDELGWPTEKLVYIPNFIDLGWFDRPKLP